MSRKKLYLSEKVNIDEYEEGGIITIEESEYLLCLGKFECEILNIVLENEYSVALDKLLTTYQGKDISKDFEQFCDKLIKYGVLDKVEL